jgi:hypothetical protein
MISTIAQEFSDILPKKQLQLVEETPIIVVQSFIDLGYFTLRQWKSAQQEKYLANAIRLFRQDLQNFKFFDSKFIGYEDLELSTKELEYLQEAIAFDNTIKIASELQLGKVNFASRLLSYRINIYGGNSNPKEPYSLATKNWLDNVSQWFSINKISAEILVDLLDEPKKITELLLKEPDFEDRILYFKTNDKKIKRSIRGRKRLFGKKLSNKAYKILFNKENLKVSKLRSKVNTAENLFLTRLLQIRLWMLGYYEGKIDNLFSIKTIDALDDFLDDEDIKFNQMVLELRTGKRDKAYSYALLNVQEILAASIDNTEKQSDDLSKIVVEIESLQQSSKKYDLEMHVNKSISNASEKAYNNLSKGRRIYLGITNFAKGLLRGLKRIFKKIENFINKIKTVATKIGKFFLVESGKALKVFFSGIAFLLGKRENRTSLGNSFIFSKYDFDFDQINISSPNVKKELLDKHIEKERDQINSMNTSLTVVTNIIKWVITISKLTTPLVWVSFVFQIIKEVKEVLIKKTIKHAF